MTSIAYSHLALAFIPVLITIAIMFIWSINPNNTLYALARMLVQLLLIGFFLDSLFSSRSHWLTMAVLCAMLLIASWIALKTLPIKSTQLYSNILIALSVGGLLTLGIMTQLVLDTSPWFDAQIIIPIAGMIFANNMNNISLAGERFYSELEHNSVQQSRNKAFQAAMIPITNSLFAVGLVSLPGMMTGQILSGTEPLIAARYQIMVMCMILGSGGISTALFLQLVINKLPAKDHTKFQD